MGDRMKPRQYDYYELDVCVAAMDLWNSANGAAERLPADEAIGKYEWLKMRLRNWRPSLEWSAPVDDAVKTMLERVIEFYEERDLESDRKWLQQWPEAQS